MQSPVLVTWEHLHPGLSLSQSSTDKGLQASSRSGHRGTSKVWQGKGGSVTKWGFVVCCLTESRHLWHGNTNRVLYVVDGSCFFFLPRQDLQTQQMIHGEARSNKGEVTKAMIPSPTRIPTTWKSKIKQCQQLHFPIGIRIPMHTIWKP